MNAYEKNSSHALQLHDKKVTEKLVLLKDEKKPLLHYSMLAQGLEEELKNNEALTIQVSGAALEQRIMKCDLLCRLIVLFSHI